MTNGQPDPTRVATYSVQTHNRLLAPQLGFEWDKSLTDWLALGVTAKGAWGEPNFVELDRRPGPRRRSRRLRRAQPIAKSSSARCTS